MEQLTDLKSEIERYANLDFTQTETIEYLLRKGFAENEIKKEIFNYFPRINKVDIQKTFSFGFSLFIVSLISVSPLIGYLFSFEIYYGLFFAILLLSVVGYAKLNKVSIVFWLAIVSVFVFYMLSILLIKLSGKFINSLYSYGAIFSALLFSVVVLTKIYDVYLKSEAFKKQYKFE